MTYFPNNLRKRPLAALVAALAPVRDAVKRDILWGKPLFKAPELLNPRVKLERLPIPVAVHITRRPDQG